MGEPVQFGELIVPNGGIDESKSPQKIDADKWSSGLDAEPLPDGVRRRNGCAESNAVALGGGVQLIADYQSSDGGTTRHLAMGDGKLYKNVAGTMTEIVHDDGALATSADVHPSWTVGQDRVFMTDNAAVGRKHVVVGGSDEWVNDGIAPPTAVLTVGQSGSGNSLDGDWRFDYYYWDDDLGVPSDRKYGGGTSGEFITVTGGQQIDISAIPAAVVRTGDRATHIRIEALEPGTTVYRLIKEITIGTTTATITDADLPTTVEGEYVHAVSPVHQIEAVAENRRFILNVADHPYRLMFSAIVGTTPYYESFTATNRRDFGKGDGDYGTALFFISPRTLIVGFRNSIWAIDPRRPLTSDRVLISSNIGIANWDAGIVIGRTLYFISDAKDNKGPYVWAPGTEPQMVRGIDNTFKGLNLSRLKYASCAYYAPGEERFQWWTLVSGASQTQHDRALVYDTQLQAWAIFSLTQKGTVVAEVEASGASKLYMGSHDGKEYLRDTGADDNGTAFSGFATMKAFDFGVQGLNKRLRFTEFLAEEQVNGAMSLSIERDYGRKTAIVTALPHTRAAGTLVWGTGTWGTDTWAGSSDEIARVSTRGRAKVFRPTISGGASWHLKGIALDAQPTRKR